MRRRASQKQTPRWLPVVVFILSAVLYTAAGCWAPFYSRGESREALVVQAVVNGGGIILPGNVHARIPSKPPLFHWLAAIPLAAGLEPEEVAVRLPSIVLGAGAVALMSAVAARWYGVRAAVLGAVVLASSFEWLRLATHARVDMTLTFFILATVLVWRSGLNAGSGQRLVRLGYLLGAAAVLTKGPVGIVLPLLIIGVAVLVERTPARLVRLLDGRGVLVAFSLCGAWYLLAWMEGGEAFLRRHLLEENIGRFVGIGKVAHSHSAFYYIPALLGGFAPWSVLLPSALWAAWRRGEPRDRFLLAWTAAVLGFYALATGKRSAYLLPMFPPLAIMTGRLLESGLARRAGRYEPVLFRIFAGVVIVATLPVVLGGAGIVTRALAPWVAVSDLGRLPVVLDLLHRNRGMLVITLGALIAGLRILMARSGGPSSRAPIAVCCAVATSWAVGLAAVGMHPTADALSPRRFAARVRAVVGEDDLLSACGHVSFAFRYYMGRPLPQWSRERDDGRRRSFVVTQAQDDDLRGRFRFATRLIQHAYPGVRSLLELDEGRTLAAASADRGRGDTKPLEPLGRRRCRDS